MKFDPLGRPKAEKYSGLEPGSISVGASGGLLGASWGAPGAPLGPIFSIFEAINQFSG